MGFQVDQKLCAGCGACMDVCSTGAISLVNHRAEIDQALCTECGACVSTCPNEAIQSVSETVLVAPAVILPAVGTGIMPAPGRLALPEKEVPTRGLSRLAGTVLTFLGREVAPRLVDFLAASIERRLTPPATTATPVLQSSPDRMGAARLGFQRKVRNRRGRFANRNFRGRR
jgi:Fe-S-cluster-containing hydrogenase component 2